MDNNKPVELVFMESFDNRKNISSQFELIF